MIAVKARPAAASAPQVRDCRAWSPIVGSVDCTRSFSFFVRAGGLFGVTLVQRKISPATLAIVRRFQRLSLTIGAAHSLRNRKDSAKPIR
jgi:hypothetical protein